jgi:hypothetical protein
MTFMPKIGCFLIALVAMSCNKQSGLEPDFVNLYTDLRISTLEFGRHGPLAESKRAEILKKYSSTSEAFNTQVQQLKSNPNLWVPFQEQVVERLDTLIQKVSSSLKVPQDSLQKKTMPLAPRLKNESIRGIQDAQQRLQPKKNMPQRTQ